MSWKRLVLGWALAFPVAAQTPVVPELGRLLLSPAEREALLAARHAPAGGDDVGAGPADAQAGAVPVQRIRLDGVVDREALPALVFLNRQAVEDGGEFLDFRLHAGRASVVLVAADGRRYRLRVGQTLLREEGRILDRIPPQSLSSPP